MKRREFLQHSTVGAVALWSAACGVDGPSPDAPPTGDVRALLPRDDGVRVFVREDVTFEVDAAAHRVLVRTDGRQVVLGAGEGDAALDTPVVALLQPGPSARVLVVDRGRARVQVYGLDGRFHGSLGAGELFMPGGAAVSEDGTLFVADTLNHRVTVFNARGDLVDAIGVAGAGHGELNAPSDVALDRAGHLHVLDAGNGRVVVFHPEGRVLATYTAPAGRFRAPTAITRGPDGVLHVADAHGAVVHAFDASGRHLKTHQPVLGGHRVTPLALSFSASGDLHVSGLPGAPA